MASDDEWVADVRRWCQRGGIDSSASGTSQCADDSDHAMLGYEAALPPLLARHWPDAAFSKKGDGSA